MKEFNIGIQDHETSSAVGLVIEEAELNMLRSTLIRGRNEALRNHVNTMNPEKAVLLSHLIALISNALEGCNQSELEKTLRS